MPNRSVNVCGRIDAQRFEGEFRTVAQGVNDMVGAHIAVKKLAMGVVAEFGRGNLDAPMDQLPGKKAFINDTIETVRGLLKQNTAAASENQRVRAALDGVPSAVMIADTTGVIRYANHSVTALLRRIESDLRAAVPNFDSGKIIGSNFDIFHRNPGHQRGIVDALRQPHRANVRFGPHSIRLVASPILDDKGQRLGAVLEWVDRSAEVRAEEEITSLVQAAGRGDAAAFQRATHKLLFLSGRIKALGTLVEQLGTLAGRPANFARPGWFGRQPPGTYTPQLRDDIRQGIAMFWDEGPGGGHYRNMVGPWREIGCGGFMGGGAVTITIEFR